MQAQLCQVGSGGIQPTNNYNIFNPRNNPAEKFQASWSRGRESQASAASGSEKTLMAADVSGMTE